MMFVKAEAPRATVNLTAPPAILPPPGYSPVVSLGPAPTPESKVGLYFGIGAAALVFGVAGALIFWRN